MKRWFHVGILPLLAVLVVLGIGGFVANKINIAFSALIIAASVLYIDALYYNRVEAHTFPLELDNGALRPMKAHASDAGFDLRSPIQVTVPAHGSTLIDTGVHINIADGFVGFLKSKSGLNCKFGIQSEGVIDAGYTGSIVVRLCNSSDVDYSVQRGDKITQIVFLPIPEVEFQQVTMMDDTERGDNGFGSSGR